MTKDTKHRSRQEILHYVLSFCVSSRYEPGEGHLGRHPGTEAFNAFGEVQVGDLVIIKGAGPSKWTIGWLVEIDWNNAPGEECYIIESLEDGTECSWGNVGLEYFPRDKLRPEWRWTDRQWAFKRRWWDVCYLDKGAYINRPVMPVFGEGFSVTLGTRTMFGEDNILPVRTFADWRKVTRAMMGVCFDECVAEHDQVRSERKEGK